MNRRFLTILRAAGVLILSGGAFACSMVSWGEVPITVTRLAGTVMADPDYHPNDAERRVPIAGALIQIKVRIDKKMTRQSNAPPEIRAKLNGAIYEWECGAIVAEKTSRADGVFAFEQLPPGKYCVSMHRGGEGESKRLWADFLVDLVPARSSTSERVVADITPLWADCTGGSKLIVENIKNASKE